MAQGFSYCDNFENFKPEYIAELRLGFRVEQEHDGDGLITKAVYTDGGYDIVAPVTQKVFDALVRSISIEQLNWKKLKHQVNS
jgi:hypothetical protein